MSVAGIVLAAGAGRRFGAATKQVAMVGGRPVSGLRVDGQWSMVIATRSRSMGSEAREGMVRGRANSMLQGHRLARWIARLRLGHPDPRAVVTRPTLYRAVA